MAVFVSVADDFTGASDQASMLAGAGMASLLVFQDDYPLESGAWEAVTYASRLRSMEPHQAAEHVGMLFRRAQSLSPHMIQYKYCSTFDSTPEGNIGPCLDAAMDIFNFDGTIVVPALPVNGRTTCHGYHFVLGVLLSESPMRDHPLNPMNDSNLVRWLALQTKRRVGLVDYADVEKGREAICKALEQLWQTNCPYAVVDCMLQRHVLAIARAVWDLPFISGSSALAMELPMVWRAKGVLAARRPVLATHETGNTVPQGGVLALVGSCARQTLQQLQQARGFQMIRPGMEKLLGDTYENVTEETWAVVQQLLKNGEYPLVMASMAPEERREYQKQALECGLTERELGSRIEALMAALATRAVEEMGVRTLLVGGGETSGAVCQALGIPAVEIVEQISPSVPLCRSMPDGRVLLALKAGNFGSDDFFEKAVKGAARWT